MLKTCFRVSPSGDIYIKFLTNSHFTQEEKKSVRKHTHTHLFLPHILSYLGSHKVWRKKIHSSGRFYYYAKKKGIVPDALSHCVKERVDRIWSPKSDAERARRSIQQHFEALIIEERI